MPLEEVQDESVLLQPAEELEVEPSDDLLETLLDEDSLATALVILEVAETIADLELLEGLNERQKRQVWKATPATLRAKVMQLRYAPVQPIPRLQPQQDLPEPSRLVVLNAKPRLTMTEQGDKTEKIFHNFPFD